MMICNDDKLDTLNTSTQLTLMSSFSAASVLLLRVLLHKRSGESAGSLFYQVEQRQDCPTSSANALPQKQRFDATQSNYAPTHQTKIQHNSSLTKQVEQRQDCPACSAYALTPLPEI
jgi:hypothetical protein